MSRLLSAAELSAPVSQLPPAAYFDEALLAREREILFANGPGYAGHSLMVPEVNDYAVLASRQNTYALTRTPAGVNLISNVCRHRQALMLTDRGTLADNGGNVVCPLHRWTYSGAGELIGAPHFPCNPALHLRNNALKSWNGLLFDGPCDPSPATKPRASSNITNLGGRSDSDFSRGAMPGGQGIPTVRCRSIRPLRKTRRR